MRSLLGLIVCSAVYCFLLADLRVEGRALKGAIAAPITSSELIEAVEKPHGRNQHVHQKRRKVRREAKTTLENLLKRMIGDESKTVPVRPGK
uniref:Uncharacterized protein n=1 Tax=Plectus sambesii TaxID=2011161 RepID=A0A914WXA7_9BILA